MIILLFITSLFLGSSVWAEGDWKILNPANSPSARFGHSLTPLPDGNILLFGGQDSAQKIYNDLHSYNNGQWTPITPANNAPPARSNHCAWYLNGKMYVHAGLSQNQLPLNDLWNYDPTTKEWTQIQPETKPSARYSHSAAVLSNGTVIITGGLNAEGTSLKDTWKFTSENIFKPLAYREFGLADHTTQAVGDMLFVFGEPNVTYTYNVTSGQWSTISTGPPLWGCSTSEIGENEAGEKLIFIFGGIKEGGQENNIVYEYNTTTNTMSQREELMPFPYSYGASAVMKSQQTRVLPLDVFFFGGRSNNQIIGTTLQFSSQGNNPPVPVSGIVNQIGALGKGQFTILYAKYPVTQSKVTLKLKWAQSDAKLCLMAMSSSREDHGLNSMLDERELLKFAEQNESLFESVSASDDRAEVEKTVEKVKTLVILVKHNRLTAVAKNIQLEIGKSENNPQNLWYMFPVGPFSKVSESYHHFVKLPVKPVRWFSRYPRLAQIQETTETGENFWQWNAVDSTQKNLLFRAAFVQFYLP